MPTAYPSKKTEKVAVFVMKGDVLVERGEFWPNGAGLSIAIEDGEMRDQVEGAIRFLVADAAAISANLECGWEVALRGEKTDA
jgi:hypothetical protein